MTDTANTTKSLNWNVIKTGGKQYIAKTGDKLRIEILKGEYKVGDEIVFDEVLMSSKDGKIEVGSPVLSGAKVKSKLTAITRDAKKLVVKYRAKSRYHKKNGHKQPIFEVEIL
jgi:large subunit ribosomal protein L21